MIDYFDHIDDYISGSLSEDLLKAFDEELAVNTELKQAIANHPLAKDISEALLEVDMMETIVQLKNDNQRSYKEENRTAKNLKKDRSPRRWLYMVAASILIAVSAYFIHQSNQPPSREQLMAQYYRPPIFEMERGINMGDLSKLDQAKYAFHLKEYEKSEQLFLELLEGNQNEKDRDEVYFYLGHVYIMLGRWDEAEGALKQTSNSEKEPILEMLKISN